MQTGGRCSKVIYVIKVKHGTSKWRSLWTGGRQPRLDCATHTTNGSFKCFRLCAAVMKSVRAQLLFFYLFSISNLLLLHRYVALKRSPATAATTFCVVFVVVIVVVGVFNFAFVYDFRSLLYFRFLLKFFVQFFLYEKIVFLCLFLVVVVFIIVSILKVAYYHQ